MEKYFGARTIDLKPISQYLEVPYVLKLKRRSKNEKIYINTNTE